MTVMLRPRPVEQNTVTKTSYPSVLGQIPQLIINNSQAATNKPTRQQRYLPALSSATTAVYVPNDFETS